jgi:hypothetical protein
MIAVILSLIEFFKTLPHPNPPFRNQSLWFPLRAAPLCKLLLQFVAGEGTNIAPQKVGSKVPPPAKGEARRG